jgi:hypothetical protein
MSAAILAVLTGTGTFKPRFGLYLTVALAWAASATWAIWPNLRKSPRATTSQILIASAGVLIIGIVLIPLLSAAWRVALLFLSGQPID